MVKSLIFTLLLLVSDYSIGIELSLYMILALFFLNFFLVSFIKWSDYFYLLFVVVALFQHLGESDEFHKMDKKVNNLKNPI
jgi:hypothetical protein